MSSKVGTVTFRIEDGVEVVTCLASDFRTAMKERDALRAECDRLGKVEGQLLAEIEQMKRHHDLFCRCDSVHYGYA